MTTDPIIEFGLEQPVTITIVTHDHLVENLLSQNTLILQYPAYVPVPYSLF